MYSLATGYRSITNPLSIAESRTEKPAMVTQDTTRLFYGPWHDAVGEQMCAHPFRMWNRLRFHMFMQVSQIFQRRNSDANKQDFVNLLNLTCQAQSTPRTIKILTKVFCTAGPNLVVLAWTGYELSQAQNGVNFDFEDKFDLEGRRSITPLPPPRKKKNKKNNRDRKQGLLHLWSKFGDPSWNGWWVIARTSSRLT